jgi:hypothetical protein
MKAPGKSARTSPDEETDAAPSVVRNSSSPATCRRPRPPRWSAVMAVYDKGKQRRARRVEQSEPGLAHMKPLALVSAVAETHLRLGEPSWDPNRQAGWGPMAA